MGILYQVYHDPQKVVLFVMKCDQDLEPCLNGSTGTVMRLNSEK